MPFDIEVGEDFVVTCSIWGHCYTSETRTELSYENITATPVSLELFVVPEMIETHLDPLCTLSTSDQHYYNVRAEVWQPLGIGYTSLGWRDFAIDKPGTHSGGPGGALPPNNALVLRRRTGLPGRANRGRIFVPGIPRGEIAGGTIGSGYKTTKVDPVLVALAEQLEDATPLPIMRPQLVSRDEFGMVKTSKDLSFWDCNIIIRSQRRRESDVGL